MTFAKLCLLGDANIVVYIITEEYHRDNNRDFPVIVVIGLGH